MVLLKKKCPRCGEQMIDEGNSYIYCRDVNCNWCISKKDILEEEVQ